MPLTVSLSYERALLDLRTLSPNTAALAESVKEALQPQALTASPESLEVQLLEHLQAVGQQQPRCATRFTVWAYAMARDGALTHQQAATFVCEAATLGGPSGGVSE